MKRILFLLLSLVRVAHTLPSIFPRARERIQNLTRGHSLADPHKEPKEKDQSHFTLRIKSIYFVKALFVDVEKVNLVKMVKFAQMFRHFITERIIFISYFNNLDKCHFWDIFGPRTFVKWFLRSDQSINKWSITLIVADEVDSLRFGSKLMQLKDYLGS